MRVGFDDGCLDGWLEGCLEGRLEGCLLGLLVGLVGPDVGCEVGFLLFLNVFNKESSSAIEMLAFTRGAKLGGFVTTEGEKDG